MIPQIQSLILQCGGDVTTRDGRLAQDLLLTTLKLISDPTGTGERKLLTNSFKELRHAFRVFDAYSGSPKVSIFGSARTPPEHPDYQAAVDLSRQMAEEGWLVITGAGDGIMKAGHEGPGAESSFGLSIHLPFETTANSIIEGDEKLLSFRYFFTRKLMFLSQCDAVVAFPGRFGTQDELLESLTLMQTGKSQIVPLVMLAGSGSQYWLNWERYVYSELWARRLINQDDPYLFHIASTPKDAARHIQRFYANYHSSRYVGDDFVIRIKRELTPKHLAKLNAEFEGLVAAGSITQVPADPVENEFMELPRIRFTHTRSSFGTVRRLIDRINDHAFEL